MNNVLRIGVVGIGGIGQSHVERINKVLKNGVVVAVSDIRREFGLEYAKTNNCKYYEDGIELINDKNVDAVIIATVDEYHEYFASECLKVGKFCFVEKPLAPDVQGCLNLVELEVAGKRKLIQVGFMRRYDDGYKQLKEIIESKKLGEPLMIHSAHRNPEGNPYFTNSTAVEGSMIHEIDVYRWLLGEEFVKAEVVYPRQSKYAQGEAKDPQIMYLTTESGIRIDVESFINSRYGYDIQCEVCFEEGTARLPEPSNVTIRHKGEKITKVCESWSNRFVDAYNIQIQQWINATLQGVVKGPTAWDGYMAQKTAATASIARDTQSAVEIKLDKETPEFYK